MPNGYQLPYAPPPPVDLEVERAIQEEIRDMEEEQNEDNAEDNFQLNQELQEGYGYPMPEERQNQHSFLHKSAFGSSDTVKTTFLHEGELGRGLFTVRFLLDMEDITIHYLQDLLIALGLNPMVDNRIANYFREKRENITSSGMSNKGFLQNLNVSRRIDTTRRRVREFPDKIKGGKRR